MSGTVVGVRDNMGKNPFPQREIDKNKKAKELNIKYLLLLWPCYPLSKP